MSMHTHPPDGLPAYRLLTGPDDDTFCQRVSEALDLGYRLHKGPAIAFDGERTVVAQAVLWPAQPTSSPSLSTPSERDRD
jgi:hypothetical protein